MVRSGSGGGQRGGRRAATPQDGRCELRGCPRPRYIKAAGTVALHSRVGTRLAIYMRPVNIAQRQILPSLSHPQPQPLRVSRNTAERANSPDGRCHPCRLGRGGGGDLMTTCVCQDAQPKTPRPNHSQCLVAAAFRSSILGRVGWKPWHEATKLGWPGWPIAAARVGPVLMPYASTGKPPGSAEPARVPGAEIACLAAWPLVLAFSAEVNGVRMSRMKPHFRR